jgi:hypothetical protein
MTTDIDKRLSQLRQRRTGNSITTESLSRADSVHAGIAEDAAGPESWETRGTSSQRWTKYAIGAMEAVGKTYTKVSVVTADRVADQLRDRQDTAGVKAEFKLQGSVPLDVHIRRVSDVASQQKFRLAVVRPPSRCDMSTRCWATRWRTSPWHCHVPYTASRAVPSASFRCFSKRRGQMMTLTLSVSSSTGNKKHALCCARALTHGNQPATPCEPPVPIA